MVAVAALAAACGTSKPAQARRGAGQVITAADQVDALAVGPDGLLYYGERVSGKVYSVTPTEYANPRLITTVEVRSDGATTPIGQSYGTGGGTDVLPFESTVTFTRPSAPRGTVVVSEPRADVADQGPAGATVVRVAF